MTTLYLDLETFSNIPIKNGAHAYAEGDEAEILLFAYAWNDEPVQVLDLINDRLNAMMTLAEIVMYANVNPCEVVAHNVNFDRTVLRTQGYHIPIDKWHCTQARALAHGLPGGLEKLSAIFQLGDKSKDKRGKELIRLFCIPQGKKRKLRRCTKETHPQQWQEFIDYALLDIEAMRVLHKRMPRWNYQGKELALWRLDQKINDRGIAVDVDLAHAAIATVDHEKKRLAKKTHDITLGEVDSATQRAKLLKFINDYWDIGLQDMKADTIEKVLKEDIEDDLRELLTTRLQASTSSTSKYNRVLSGMSHDHRLRGLLKFSGAARTGRWSGQLFQPQNLMRPTMKNPAIEEGIEAMKGGYANEAYDNVMEVAANAMRGVLIASPKKKLVVSDLANIEGRSAAYLADEDWKLDAFRAYDAGTGRDTYVGAYCNMFHCDPEDVDELKRQIGKVCELMLQYEGGVGAWITGAMTYGIDLKIMAENAIDLLPKKAMKDARQALAWAKKKEKTYGLADNTYIVCDAFKRMWRDAHPGITGMWKELDDAMRNAIENPNVVYRVGRLKVTRRKKWLKVILPSGRALSYPSPRISDDGKITYMGQHIFTKKWCRISTYGGKVFENVCQAFARDVIAEQLPMIDEAGYLILLTIHDEDITETPDSKEFTSEGLSALMTAPIEWCPGLPLAAKGHEGYRYRKG